MVLDISLPPYFERILQKPFYSLVMRNAFMLSWRSLYSLQPRKLSNTIFFTSITGNIQKQAVWIWIIITELIISTNRHWVNWTVYNYNISYKLWLVVTYRTIGAHISRLCENNVYNSKIGVFMLLPLEDNANFSQ